jgi:hypothetical protein
MASREAWEIVGYSPRIVVARTAFATVGQWYFRCFLGWGTDLKAFKAFQEQRSKKVH